jgi:hypothetical protein
VKQDSPERRGVWFAVKGVIDRRVDVVFAAVAKGEPARFLCQRPDEAFTGGGSIRLTGENGVREGFVGGDDVPALRAEQSKQIDRKKECSRL